MSIRELMSWRDVVRCVVAALVMTLVFCGVPYVAAGGPMPGLSIADAATSHPIVAKKLSPVVTRNVPAAAPAHITQAVAAWPKAYHVLSGDSLSVIAQKLYGNAHAWPVIYWANKYEIRYANIIQVGQNLTIPAMPAVIPAGPRVVAPPVPHSAVLTSSMHVAPRKTYTAVAQPRYTAVATSYQGGSGFQACVIRAESGGNPFAQNPVST